MAVSVIGGGVFLSLAVIHGSMVVIYMGFRVGLVAGAGIVVGSTFLTCGICMIRVWPNAFCL